MIFSKKNVVKNISIILLITAIAISCVNTKPSLQNNGQDVLSNSTIMQVENIPEGILFTFDTIPENTSTLFINIYADEHDGKQWADVFGIVVGQDFDELKKTKKIICPFVKKDTNYFVSFNFLDSDYALIPADQEPVSIVSANDGIYTINNFEFRLNETKTGAAFSAEPEFSSLVEFDERKYEYVLLNFIDENSSFSSGIYSGDELSCTFIPDTVTLVKEYDPELNGTFPSHVAALCNINYENVLWKVCVDKTEDFLVEFQS